MSTRKKSNRAKKFVDSKVQGALALRVIRHFCTFLVLGGVFGLVIQYLANPFMPVSEHLTSFWTNIGPYLFTLLLLLPLFVYDTMKLSNRIVGPIYRMRNTMREIGSGDEPRQLKFRDGDFWQDMAGEFNGMVSELQQQKTQQVTEDSTESVAV